MAELSLPAVLTMVQARDTLARLEAALQASRAPVLVDAGELQTLDSAALAVLLQCRRLALQSGQPFKISAAPAKLIQLARLYGVDGLLELA
jgi:phospholipid transport system transporter-binding protein